MAERVSPRRRRSYGIAAPFAPAFLAGLVVFYFVLATVTGRVKWWLAGTFILAVVAFYLYNTLRGKFVVWAGLLDRLGLRGDERILDLGCGRGAVLLMAARHLATGRAVGVDLWRKGDQSGNSAEAGCHPAAARDALTALGYHAFPFCRR